jgi:WD40-like Beta Propeller Repeat
MRKARTMRKERGVEQRLRSLHAPGEADAERRAWELAAAAHAARDHSAARDRYAAHDPPAAPPGAGAAAGSRRFALRRPAVALVTLAALLTAAVTPPGSAVADWVGDAVRSVVGDDRPPSQASGLDRLPGGGRVLVLASRRGGGPPEPWIAGDGGHRRLAGAVSHGAWSPSGRFVALARESELFAVDLSGRRRWSIPTPGRVHDAVWSPDGFRVAYTAGAELRLVAGDGTGDRRVAFREPARVGSPFGGLAWRPGPRHVLAFSDARTLFAADTDQRRVLWQRKVRGGAGLAFTPDGSRLLVVARRDLLVVDADDGRTLQRVRRRRWDNLVSATWDRTGRRLALVYRGPATAELLVGRPHGRTIRLRRRFAAGDLGQAQFSPDNRWLMIHWVENDSWLFLPIDGGRPRQITGLRRRFNAAEVTPKSWCCH